METQHVLVLGAGGNVSRHSVPKLVNAGHSVSALVRNPDDVQQLVDDGATAIVRDLTTLNQEDWARLLTPFDVVVWSAGAGGGSAELTYAVDRDAAMAMIDALEELGEFAPISVCSPPTCRTRSSAPPDSPMIRVRASRFSTTKGIPRQKPRASSWQM